jgi:hypothetical protein
MGEGLTELVVGIDPVQARVVRLLSQPDTSSGMLPLFMYSLPYIPTKNEVSVFSFITYQVRYPTLQVLKPTQAQRKKFGGKQCCGSGSGWTALFCRIRIESGHLAHPYLDPRPDPTDLRH